MPTSGPSPRNKKPAPKTDYAADMKAAQKKGDKKAFYTAQRKRAEKTGDTKTLDKITTKNKKAEMAQGADRATGMMRKKIASTPAAPKKTASAAAPAGQSRGDRMRAANKGKGIDVGQYIMDRMPGGKVSMEGAPKPKSSTSPVAAKKAPAKKKASS
jgi:hypothetical protein